MGGSAVQIHPDWVMLSAKEPTEEDLRLIQAEEELQNKLDALAEECLRLSQKHGRPVVVYLRGISNQLVRTAVAEIIAVKTQSARRHPQAAKPVAPAPAP